MTLVKLPNGEEGTLDELMQMVRETFDEYLACKERVLRTNDWSQLDGTKMRHTMMQFKTLIDAKEDAAELGQYFLRILQEEEKRSSKRLGPDCVDSMLSVLASSGVSPDEALRLLASRCELLFKKGRSADFSRDFDEARNRNRETFAPVAALMRADTSALLLRTIEAGPILEPEDGREPMISAWIYQLIDQGIDGTFLTDAMLCQDPVKRFNAAKVGLYFPKIKARAQKVLDELYASNPGTSDESATETLILSKQLEGQIDRFVIQSGNSVFIPYLCSPEDKAKPSVGMLEIHFGAEVSTQIHWLPRTFKDTDAKYTRIRIAALSGKELFLSWYYNSPSLIQLNFLFSFCIEEGRWKEYTLSDGAFVSNGIGANEVTEQDLKRSLSGGELMYRRTKGTSELRVTLDASAHHLDNSTPNYLDFGTLTLSEDSVDPRGPNELKISDQDDRWLIGLRKYHPQLPRSLFTQEPPLVDFQGFKHHHDVIKELYNSDASLTFWDNHAWLLECDRRTVCLITSMAFIKAKDSAGESTKTNVYFVWAQEVPSP